MQQASAVIDRRTPVPLHEQCKGILLGRIRSGAYRAGMAIPPEQRLVEELGLSRTTVRQALAELVQLGLLMRVQGKGTFVTGSLTHFDLREFSSFTEDMRARGLRPSGTVLSAGLVEAPDDVLDALRTANPVYKLERVRCANGSPIGFHVSYLPRKLAIPPAELTDTASLYELLARLFHVELMAADEVLEAVNADAKLAEVMQVEVGAALLKIDRISFDPVGQPMESNVMYYRADRYKYYVRPQRR